VRQHRVSGANYWGKRVLGNCFEDLPAICWATWLGVTTESFGVFYSEILT
jgi:hypothetical protein